MEHKTEPESSFIIPLKSPWQVKWLQNARKLQTIYSVNWQGNQVKAARCFKIELQTMPGEERTCPVWDWSLWAFRSWFSCCSVPVPPEENDRPRDHGYPKGWKNPSSLCWGTERFFSKVLCFQCWGSFPGRSFTSSWRILIVKKVF